MTCWAFDGLMRTSRTVLHYTCECLRSGSYIRSKGYIQLVQKYSPKWLVLRVRGTKKVKKKQPPIAKTTSEEDYYHKGLARLAKQYGPVYRIDLGWV